MKIKMLMLILSAAMITSVLCSCSSGTVKDTETVPASAAQSATQPAPAVTKPSAAESTAAAAAAVTETAGTGGAADENLPDGIANALSAMILTYGQDDYGPDTVVANDQAIAYLENITRLFYSDRAESFDAISTEYKYAAFDETEIDQLLDEAFGGRYSTAELLTEDTLVVYNAHMYYVPLQDDGTAAPEMLFVAGDQTSNEYILTVTDQGVQQLLTLTVALSADNSSGYSIVSYTLG